MYLPFFLDQQFIIWSARAGHGTKQANYMKKKAEKEKEKWKVEKK